MFAHRIAALTGPDDVVWTEAAEPSGGVVVDVAAAGVSFADLLQTRGAYQMRVPLPYTPGMDAAGVVRACTPGAGFRPGQRVAVLVPYGCWQENRLLLGNTGVLGVASREFFERHPALVTELWGQLLELRQTGSLADPPVEAYPFADARGALRAIADRRALGKVVLSRSESA